MKTYVLTIEYNEETEEIECLSEEIIEEHLRRVIGNPTGFNNSFLTQTSVC